VLVDTGDFSSDPDEPGRIKNESLLEGMGAMGYDVLNVGLRELAGGLAAFRAAAAKSKLLFTNANFVYRDSGEPIFPPFVVREGKLASGRIVKIGYVGLDGFDSAFAKETPEGRVVVMRDPVEAAKLVMPAVRGRVDLLVLLGNLSLRDLTTVLSAAKGFDLALASYGPRLSEGGRLESVVGVPTLYSGDQGKRMGEVRLRLGKKGDAPVMTSNQVFLTRRYPAEPKMQSLVDRTIARVNDANKLNAQRIAAATPGAAPAAPPRAPSPVSGETSAVPAVKPFVTSLGCEGCHQKQVEVFKASAHARAFATLVKANQDFNPACVKCHVTGFSEPSGFVNARQTPDLANVQCEACHGNAAGHVADPQKPFGAVPPRACFTCHTKENSPDFVFFKYWNQIKH
jgi:hypothetical protein